MLPRSEPEREVPKARGSMKIGKQRMVSVLLAFGVAVLVGAVRLVFDGAAAAAAAAVLTPLLLTFLLPLLLLLLLSV